MTDEQLKELAEIVLSHERRLEMLTTIISNLIDRAANAGDDFGGRANKLRSEIEQLSADVELAKIARKQMRERLGLPSE